MENAHESKLSTAERKALKKKKRDLYKELNKNSTYIIGLDPSMGTGSDYSAIQVFCLPGFQQVAEWKHNKTDVRNQMLILQSILETIYNITKDEEAIYYTIENNGIGRTSIQALD